MKSNDDKCHLIVANECKKSYQSNNFIYLRNTFLQGEDLVKLLGLQVEEDLSIETHLNSVIKKGNQKLHALMRISKYQSSEKLRFHCNSFVKIWNFSKNMKPIKCLKGHKSLELLFVCQNQKVSQCRLSESVSDKVTYWAVLDS